MAVIFQARVDFLGEVERAWTTEFICDSKTRFDILWTITVRVIHPLSAIRLNSGLCWI